EGAEHSILESSGKGLAFFEDKVIEFVDIATRHFENLLKEEQMENDRAERELEENDPLFEPAILLVVENQKASISLIQRHFRIGYNRAARIIERLESKGIITSPDANGSRNIIVGKDYKYEEKTDDVPISNNVIQFKR
ncbi:DNA translocase FtsK, partial [Escherichia coli]